MIIIVYFSSLKLLKMLLIYILDVQNMRRPKSTCYFIIKLFSESMYMINTFEHECEIKPQQVV